MDHLVAPSQKCGLAKEPCVVTSGDEQELVVHSFANQKNEQIKKNMPLRSFCLLHSSITDLPMMLREKKLAYVDKQKWVWSHVAP